MREVTIKKTVFSFEDIQKDENLKSKVLEKQRDINVKYVEWYEGVIEVWTEKLENMGFNSPKIAFSGFWSQGDGASFLCESVDVEKLMAHLEIKDRFNLCANYLSVTVEAKMIRSHYVHENSTYLDSENELEYKDIIYQNAIDFINKKFDEIDGCLYSINKQIYQDLEKEYDYRVSEKSVIETIEANGYEFDEEGEIV